MSVRARPVLAVLAVRPFGPFRPLLLWSEGESALNPTLLRLLGVLHAAADAEGEVEITVAKLASTLGDVGERQVQRLLRALEAAGHVIPLDKRGGRGIPGRYRLGRGDI